MTTIVYRDGVMAADSCITMSDESAGDHKGTCVKLFRLPKIKDSLPACIVGLQGESSPGMAWLEWYKGGQEDDDLKSHIRSSGADFTALVLYRHGLFVWDSWLVPERIEDDFYAIGSGTKAAYGALHMGADAVKAVEVACLVDPYTAGPVKHFYVQTL